MALDILIWISNNNHSINDLKFDILDKQDCYGKSGYTYVNPNKINISTIESHLKNNSIDIQFQDKSTNDKKYLTVYKV